MNLLSQLWDRGAENVAKIASGEVTAANPSFTGIKLRPNEAIVEVTSRLVRFCRENEERS